MVEITDADRKKLAFDAIDRLGKGESKKSIAKQFCVSVATLDSWIRRRNSFKTENHVSKPIDEGRKWPNIVGRKTGNVLAAYFESEAACAEYIKAHSAEQVQSKIGIKLAYLNKIRAYFSLTEIEDENKPKRLEKELTAAINLLQRNGYKVERVG